MDYYGTFDGDGHTISGLQNTIGFNDDVIIGLFASTNSCAVIRNVGIVNCSFRVAGVKCSVGGVCGENHGTIENCYTTGSINAIGDGQERI